MGFAGIGTNQCLVMTSIILRHSSRGKSFLELPAHLASIEFAKPSDSLNSLCFPRYDKAGDAVVDDLRYRARLERNDGRAAGHGLDHHKAERFWPIDRK